MKPSDVPSPALKAQADAAARQDAQRRLGRAWAAVLGDPARQLSDDQALVWDDLRAWCFDDRTTIVLDREGRVEAMATAAHEGRRQLLLHVRECMGMLHQPNKVIPPPITGAPTT